MTDSATKAKREYMRKWRAANKDKVKAHQQKYWERKAAELEAKEGKDNAAAEYADNQRNGAAVEG